MITRELYRNHRTLQNHHRFRPAQQLVYYDSGFQQNRKYVLKSNINFFLVIGVNGLTDLQHKVEFKTIGKNEEKVKVLKSSYDICRFWMFTVIFSFLHPSFPVAQLGTPLFLGFRTTYPGLFKQEPTGKQTMHRSTNIFQVVWRGNPSLLFYPVM